MSEYLVENKNRRSSGRTTRLADKYVQDFFNAPNAKIKIRDHEDDNMCHMKLYKRVRDRLVREHHIKEGKTMHTYIEEKAIKYTP